MQIDMIPDRIPRFPDQIITPRSLLRAWHTDDAPRLRKAIDANLDYLLPWIPWAREEPTSFETLTARLEGYASSFATGPNWAYAVMSPDESALLGGIGLHQRIGQGGLEIGYWIDREYAGKGLATEVARAITTTAFALDDISHVEIRCDPNNLPSAAIAKRLGFQLIEILPNVGSTPAGTPRDLMVWRLERSGFLLQGTATRRVTDLDTVLADNCAAVDKPFGAAEKTGSAE
jgi:RimJ/RimL family protein N-acetyltransferase